MKPTPSSWLWQDEVWQPAQSLPLSDRAIRYGMAVFETIGIRYGVPLLWQEHLELLAQGAKKLLALTLPDLTRPSLPPRESGVLRLYITAGDGSPTDPVSHPRIFALFENFPTGLPWREQTARLHPEPVTPFAHGWKTANYWPQCAAQEAARSAGFDHALIADREGNLLSAALGNLFFILEGKLCTPALSLAVRPGVIRSWIQSEKSVEEKIFPAGRLDEVAELFMTNSRQGVVPLHYQNISSGPVGRALRTTCLRQKITP